MKKIILMTYVLTLSILARPQHLETTIKIVNGKARICVKAVGGSVSGDPSSYLFTVAIPIANAAADLIAPIKLDATRVPASLSPISSYQDISYEYFNLFYSGATGASATFLDDTEYELLELRWAGAAQSCPITLFSMAEGNPSAPLAQGLWLNYLEVGGSQVSFGNVVFYSTGGQSTVNSQMAADYLSGTASITTNLLVTLPVSFVNFSGYKSGSKNVLKWTTANEQYNQGFEVQRSADGVNYAPAGFVNTKAPGGNSSTELDYTFDDNSPLSVKKSYYRLKQVDIDSRSKLSNIVVINGDKPKIVGISGIYPNPAREQVNVIIDAPQREDVTLIVMDVNGKTVKQKVVNVETGSNTVPVEIGQLASGSYLIKVAGRSSDGESVTAKFVKH